MNQSQIAIPCCLMRGGTSKGPFFLESDLPGDVASRDKVLLAAMGSPDKRQIDGVGGAHPLTSKVGIVRRGETEGVDLEFLFAQLTPESDLVDTTPNCGNMLAAAVPFAVETGLLTPNDGASTYRVLTRNTGTLSDITVATQGGQMDYHGETHIDGVPGAASPVKISFLDTAGSVCGSLLPTGQEIDLVDNIEITCIDNGMPVILFRARDMGCTGYETAAELNANEPLKAKIEALRLKASLIMGLGDVARRNYPKMCLIAPPQDGGGIATRCFIPHVCHDAVGVLAAVTIASACVLKNSICRGIAQIPAGLSKSVSVEHPTGEFTVEIALDPRNPQNVERAALIRTARLLMKGSIMVPAQIFG
ncbi:MAG: 4-oxalomesaconate tautomerase [Oscillospiraceae bacterium]|jgi:4-oxalomesaconate tautomerase|nr:4-oxalomesaconate tautomerase [Oscillospiraceae bacterium]